MYRYWRELIFWQRWVLKLSSEAEYLSSRWVHSNIICIIKLDNLFSVHFNAIMHIQTLRLIDCWIFLKVYVSVTRQTRKVDRLLNFVILILIIIFFNHHVIISLFVLFRCCRALGLPQFLNVFHAERSRQLLYFDRCCSNVLNGFESRRA